MRSVGRTVACWAHSRCPPTELGCSVRLFGEGADQSGEKPGCRGPPKADSRSRPPSRRDPPRAGRRRAAERTARPVPVADAEPAVPDAATPIATARTRAVAVGPTAAGTFPAATCLVSSSRSATAGGPIEVIAQAATDSIESAGWVVSVVTPAATMLRSVRAEPRAGSTDVPPRVPARCARTGWVVPDRVSIGWLPCGRAAVGSVLGGSCTVGTSTSGTATDGRSTAGSPSGGRSTAGRLTGGTCSTGTGVRSEETDERTAVTALPVEDLVILPEALSILIGSCAWCAGRACGAVALRAARTVGAAAVFLCTVEIRRCAGACRETLFSRVCSTLEARWERTGATFFGAVRTTLVARWLRTGAMCRATRRTGAALALVLILTGWDRWAAVARALLAACDPTDGRTLWASLPSDVPTGAGVVSAYEEVAARATPTITPAVATRILSTQRAAVAPTTPVPPPSRRSSLAPRRGASIDQM